MNDSLGSLKSRCKLFLFLIATIVFYINLIIDHWSIFKVLFLVGCLVFFFHKEILKKRIHINVDISVSLAVLVNFPE